MPLISLEKLDLKFYNYEDVFSHLSMEWGFPMSSSNLKLPNVAYVISFLIWLAHGFQRALVTFMMMQ